MIRYNPKINEGLNDSQINYRIKEGYINYNTDVKTRTIGQILFYNIFTLFNFLNLFLGFIIFCVHEYKNLLFLGVVICNTLISIIQEIRSKKIIDKLSVVSTNELTVIRNSKEQIIPINKIVLDDIIKFRGGNQVVTDSIILDGDVIVDESFISGEQIEITKEKGDTLYSGSFIVSGQATAKVERVGKDNYVSKITQEAKYIKKVNSLLLNTLNKIIKIISILIIPIGIILFYKQYSINPNFSSSIVNTVAAIIGMIPEGLILLTSTVLAVSTIRLSKKNVLVQQLYCIETLARVDTICLDKTGTLTLGEMEVEDVIVLNKKYDYKLILSNLANVLKEDNDTMKAIYKKFKSSTKWDVKKKENFTSNKKYSSVTFKQGKYILGAPDILDNSIDMRNLIYKYSDYRQVLLKTEKENIALILLKDKIRKDAKEILDYFKKYDVDVKIISGDSIQSVMNIANRLKLKNLNAIDMSVNKTNMNHQIVENYNIFCRVSPSQKKELVTALKNNGHIVAMTGDGVNDVLALKEADCSITFKSGTAAARNVSELVLFDEDFSVIPNIVEEGRRTINNIERSASLYLTKTTYATILALIFTMLPMNYPFQPIQLSLIGAITIGIPAFILALEPNNDIVEGNFLKKVLRRAIPTGLTIVINILVVMLLGNLLKFSSSIISTLCVILVTTTGFIHLYKLCKKFNLLRLILYISLIILFLILFVFLREFFEFVVLSKYELLFIVIMILIDIVIYNFIYRLFNKKISFKK